MFDSNQSIILENDRVCLRPLQAEDYNQLVAFALAEPNLWTYSLMQPNSPENMKIYINHAIKQRQLLMEYPFIVFDKLHQQYAGSTRFYDIQLVNQSLQLGYTWYGKKFQGTGLNKHCKFLLLQFAFENMGIERVEFRADNLNEVSKAAMKSIGCKVEGVIRSHAASPNGGRRDSILLSILKQEWNDEVKPHLMKIVS